MIIVAKKLFVMVVLEIIVITDRAIVVHTIIGRRRMGRAGGLLFI